MKSITEAEFNQWLNHGYPGSRITYYTGHLAHDREGMLTIAHGDHEHTTHTYNEPQHSLADAVYRAAEDGRVWLFQQRVEPNVFYYIAQKRNRRINRRRSYRA